MTRRRKPSRPPATAAGVAGAPAEDHPSFVPLHGGQKVGGWADPDANAGRYYTPDRLGAMCPVCRNRMPAALADEHNHPCCGPDAARLLTLARATLRARIGSPRRKAQP